jgi:hypothetical protein
MDATLGQVQRQTNYLVVFFVTIAAALLVGLAGGYGIRAWTYSSSPVAAAPVQAIPKAVPGYGIGAWNTGGFVAPLPHSGIPPEDLLGAARTTKLPDRSDITNGSNNSTVVNHSGDSRLGGRH